MKRMLSLLLVFALLLSLAACGNPGPTSSDVPTYPTETLALAAAVAGGGDANALQRITDLADAAGVEAYLADYYGIPKEDWVEVGCWRLGGAEAFETAVILLKDEEAAQRAAAGLETFRYNREGDFTGYFPDQAEMVSESIVLSDGNYAALLICPDPAAAEDALLDILHGNAVPAVSVPPAAVPSPSPSPSQLLPETAAPTKAPATAQPTKAPETAVPTEEPTPAATETPTAEPSAAPTETPPAPTPTQTIAPTPTPVPSDPPAPTPADAATPSPTAEPTAAPTEEPSPTAEPTPEPTPTPTVTPTPEPTPTLTPSHIPIPIPTPVHTIEPTPTPTPVPTPTYPPTPTPTPTPSYPVTYPGRTPYYPPGDEDMTVYDTSAILAAWDAKDPSVLSDYDRTIYDRASAVLDQVLDDNMDAWDIEWALYKWVITHMSYDQDHEDPFATVDRNSYTPYGGLVNHKGVCLGFASLFQLLMDMAGQECILVVGSCYDSHESHAWNMVRIQGKWYCVDSTWDWSWYTERGLGTNYFNVTSNFMAREHQWDYNNVPEATSSRPQKPSP